jgi:hypothetical protein
MKPVPNRPIMARRYFECAQKQILFGENTAVDHIAIARQYLLLAEDELTAAKRSIARVHIKTRLHRLEKVVPQVRSLPPELNNMSKGRARARLVALHILNSG